MPDSVIDWELAMELAGNDKAFAKQMFLLLVKDLGNELPEIKKEYITQQITSLKKRLHRLHGALCYCGAPRLKNATAALERALENNKDLEIANLMKQFELEIKELITQVTSPAF